MVLLGLLDLDAEIAKVNKSIASKEGEVTKIKGQMAAPSWGKVPDAVKEQTAAKMASTEVEVEALRKALESFSLLKAEGH
jgi:valyl-tRNA synthetase